MLRNLIFLLVVVSFNGELLHDWWIFVFLFVNFILSGFLFMGCLSCFIMHDLIWVFGILFVSCCGFIGFCVLHILGFDIEGLGTFGLQSRF